MSRPEDVRRLIDQAVAQGLPKHVEDVPTLERVAAVAWAGRETGPPSGPCSDSGLTSHPRPPASRAKEGGRRVSSG